MRNAQPATRQLRNVRQGLSIWCGLYLMGKPTESAALPKLRIAGSSTVLPVAEAWAARVSSSYDVKVEGGGSSDGARRVCLDRSHIEHVDIGDMSRDWKASEAVQLDDGYTLECVTSKNRVTQISVGIDGLAVVVKKGGVAHDCLTSADVGGLTLAELRWMFTDWSDEMLRVDGVDMVSVLRNDNNNGIKEWSDLHMSCAAVPINPYGAGDRSGTHDFFAEVVLCTECFQKKEGYEPEYFPNCAPTAVEELKSLSSNRTAATRWIANSRISNCYMHSEVDEEILDWVLSDGGGIAYFGFAYFSAYALDLTVVRVASDRVRGVQDTSDAIIAPSSYTITDGSYSVFRRNLFMNVDNEAWPLVKEYITFGFSAEGQSEVARVGYVNLNAALKAKMEQRFPEGNSKGNERADYVPVKPEMCSPGMRLLATQTVNRFGAPKVNYSCTKCFVGTFKSSSEPSDCTECLPGSFADAEGLSLCKICKQGTFSKGNTSHCTECPTNEFVGASGKSACQACPAGMFTSGPGHWMCTHCPLGTYRQPGNESCLPCGPGMTTAYQAATTPVACLCSAGSYLGPDGATCSECPDGMTCPLGSSHENLERVEECSVESGNEADAFVDRPDQAFPLVLRGYMTRTTDRFRVFKCTVPSKCPGGCPGTCAQNRDTSSVACGICLPNHYESDEVCKKCDRADVLPTLLTACFAIIIVGLLAFAVNRDLHMQSRAQLVCIILCGLMFTCVQTVGVFDQLNMEWYEPAKTIFRIVRLFSFDLDIIRIACIVGSDPVTSYACRQLIAPMCVPFILLSVSIKKLFQRRTDIWMDFANATGTILQVFFISIVLSTTVPFICFQHPGDAGHSLVSANSVECSKGPGSSYLNMVVISIVAMLLVPLPFVAYSVYGTLMYPRFISGMTTRSREECLGLNAFRFLFVRFRSERYFFGCVLLLRSLAICLVPVMVAEDSAIQIIFLSSILAAFTLIQQQLGPWRDAATNVIDGVFSMLLVLLLTSGAMGLGVQVNMESLRIMGTVVFVGILALFLFSLGVYIVRRLRPRPFYSFFICHHKADAGGQARLFKNLLQARTSKRVFIDSDDLMDLDGLFDIVKCQVDRLLVLLTRETLARPWCAGEIVTAFKSRHVKVTLIRTPSFQLPTVDFLTDPSNLLDQMGISILMQYHITQDDLSGAYRELLSSRTPSIRLRTELCGVRRFDALVSEVTGKKRLNRGSSEAVPNRAGALVISSEPGNDEATAAAGILGDKVQERVFSLTGESVCRLADYELDFDIIEAVVSKSCATVVILSSGSMESETQLFTIFAAIGAIQKMGESLGPRVIPVSTPGFTFPSEDYFTQVLPRFCRQGNMDNSREALHAFFRRIAVTLSTHASDRVLDIQAQEVLSRLPAINVVGGKPAPVGLERSNDLAARIAFFRSLSTRSQQSSSDGNAAERVRNPGRRQDSI